MGKKIIKHQFNVDLRKILIDFFSQMLIDG